MKNLSLLYLIIIIIAGGCKQDDEMVEAEAMRIYYQKDIPDYRVRVTDIVKITDDNLLLLEVGGNPVSKFDGNGDIFFHLIDKDGENSKRTKISLAFGFPTNIVANGDKYVVIWNTRTKQGDYLFQKVVFDINKQEITVTDTIKINENNGINTIARIIKNDHDNGYYILGTSGIETTDDEYKQIYVASLNEEFTFNTILSDYEYDAEDFGVFTSDDIPLLEIIDNHLIFKTFQDGYLCNIPYNSNMMLFYNGSRNPLYSTDGWPRMIEKSTVDDKIVVLNSNLDNSDTFLDYFIFNENTSTHNSPGEAIAKDIDVEAPIIMKEIPDENDFITVGTTYSGQLFIIILESPTNSSNNNIIKNIRIGNTYSYEVTGIEFTDNNTMLVIIGTTKVEFKDQSTFFIKIPIEELR